MAVPYTFGTATAAIPLSQLDSNFATAITLGNTAVYLGNTTTSIGNLTLTNVTISSGSVTITDTTVSGNVTLSGGTANGVAYLNGSKVLTTGSALTFDGSTLTNTGVGYSINNANALLRFGNAAATRTGYLQVRSDAFEVWSDQAAVPMVFGTSNTEQMRLTSTGLGIGTSSPSAKLTVNDANGVPIRIGDISAAPVSQTAVYIGASTSGLSGAGNGDLVLIPRTSDARSILFWTGNGTAAERARIDSSGNLGLGVTPSAWASGFKAIQVAANVALWGGTGTTGPSYFTNNVIFDGARKYINTAAASEYQQNSGVHSWLTAPSGTAGNTITFTQAATLNAAGDFLVGKTSQNITTNGYEFSPAYWASGVGQLGITGNSSSNSQNALAVYSTAGSAYRFYVSYGGNIYATNIVITAISDQRLKENVRDIETGLDAIMALKPRRFDWKEGKGQDKKNAAGFIAQEFAEIFPASVSVGKAGGDGVEYLNMNHEELIPSLVKAIQELKTEFDSYKATHP